MTASRALLAPPQERLTGTLADDLAALVAAPSRAATVPPEHVPALLGALEQLRVALWARLLESRGEAPTTDRLLGVDEAAARLATSPDWLRRHGELPFVVRLSAGQVRYSEAGIERFIRRRPRA